MAAVLLVGRLLMWGYSFASGQVDDQPLAARAAARPARTPLINAVHFVSAVTFRRYECHKSPRC
jgi:hypothetical protein